MIQTVDGFKALPWPELKEKLLQLPILPTPFNLDKATQIIGNSQFIESHIKIIDAAPPNKKGLTIKEERRRKMVKPYYDRLLKYYYLRTLLIEA